MRNPTVRRFCFILGVGLLGACGGGTKLKAREPFNEITVERHGAGLVLSEPTGIACGGTCVEKFADGTVVHLRAIPDHAEGFVGWDGSCTGKEDCTLTADASRKVIANFLDPLTVETQGAGTVTLEPTGTACGSGCTALYVDGTQVSLVATPSPGASFEGWSGACAGTGTCLIAMDGNKQVKATFSAAGSAQHQLVVNLAGSGTGTVSSVPAGIECPSACNLEVQAGTQVTLTATATGTSDFVGWSGACSGAAATCLVTMDLSKSVTARFEQPILCSWSRRFGASYMDRIGSVATNKEGHILVAGTVWGQVDLGGGTLDNVPSGAGNFVVATYNGDGSFKSAFGRGASTAVTLADSAVYLPNGDVAVVGAFSGTVDLGVGASSDNVNTGGLFRGFLGVYQLNGAARWVQPLGATSMLFDGFSEVIADAQGELTVTGEFAEPVNLGGPGLLTPNNVDLFVARYSQSGAFRWEKQVGGPGAERSLGLALVGTTVVATGQASEGSDFGGGALAAGTTNEAFFAAYDSTGNSTWQRTLGTPAGQDVGNALVALPNGEVAATGDFEGTVTFGGTALISNGSTDVFVTRLSSTGAPVWSRSFGGPNWDSGAAIATDGAGNIAVAGAFNGTVDFGTGPKTSQGGSDLFVIKLDLDGSTLWVKTFGGVGNERLGGVAFDRSGNVVIGGAFENSVDFGFGALGSVGYEDMFLACIGQ